MELLAALYDRRARDSIQGRLQIRKVIFRDYREDPAILWSAGGAAAVI
jgi:hypothetical protein